MTASALAESRFRQFLALTKPRVVSLIVFCAVIGMFLAVPGLPPADVVFMATVGIALVAGAAAAVNCLVEQKIDAVMLRTRGVPARRQGAASCQCECRAARCERARHRRSAVAHLAPMP